jgi:L-ascorbate metabolism protein UlaG (beta-lactamase superfamily)
MRSVRPCVPGLIVTASILAGAGCAPFAVRLDQCPAVSAPPSSTPALSIRYLGVGGFLLSRGDDVVLAAPMYTNPSLLEVVADHEIRPDAERVDRLLPREADAAGAILVGHSHYDHLLDVSVIARARAKSARIYGSGTLAHLLAPFADLAPRVEVVDAKAAHDAHAGQWIPVGRGVRLLALRSEHSTQVTLNVPFTNQPIPIHLWRGTVVEDRATPPARPSEWAEGEVYAYLVDFLDVAGRPQYRVYYQDSGTNPRKGYVPEAVIAEKRVDVALLCVGGDFHRLRRHPEGIIENTRARDVVLGHWEDFFVPQDEYAIDGRVYPIPSFGKETPEFVARARKALRAAGSTGSVWLPCPTSSTFQFLPEGRP